MRGLRWSAVGPTSAAPVVNDSYMHPGASVPLSKHLLFRRRRSSGTGQMLVVRWNSVPRAACHLGITLYFRATIYCGATQQDLCSTEHIAARKPPQLLIRDTCIVTRCFLRSKRIIIQDVRSLPFANYDIVEDATPVHVDTCPYCHGPLILDQGARTVCCFQCKHVPCWKCKAPIISDMPSDLEFANLNGRADVEAMAAFCTCRGCGGYARTPAPRRSSWRKCSTCRKPLYGKPGPGRSLDLCTDCKKKRLRGQWRSASRRKR
jgi:hypothetical protein